MFLRGLHDSNIKFAILDESPGLTSQQSAITATLQEVAHEVSSQDDRESQSTSPTTTGFSVSRFDSASSVSGISEVSCPMLDAASYNNTLDYHRPPTTHLTQTQTTGVLPIPKTMTVTRISFLRPSGKLFL